MRRGFHQGAQLITVEQGAIVPAATYTWFDRTAAKRAAGSGTLTAKPHIMGIDCESDAAVAKVRLEFDTHTFVDYLSLLKSETGCTIVNKI